MRNQPRREFMKTLAATSIAAAFPGLSLGQKAEPEARGPKPNVVMIVSDDQGFGDLSYYGNRVLKTPHLDALATQGVRLNHFIVSPLCSPSRAALMTGRYDYRVGVWDTYGGRAMLRDGEEALPAVLAAGGYRTGFFGKWHLGANYPSRPQDKGFDFVCSYGSPKFDPWMNVNGTRRKFSGFVEDVLFDEAARWIEKNREGPFLAYVASKLPHDTPRPMAPEGYVAPFRGLSGLGEGDADVYGMVANLDQNVGKLLGRISDLGLEQNTIVIFLADNGPLRQTPDLKTPYEMDVCAEYGITDRYNMGLRAGKTSVYEGGIRVPCFFRWPARLPAGSEMDRLSAHIDILPTLIDLCGVAPPLKARFDGRSLAPLLEGKSTESPERQVVVQSDRVPVPRRWYNACVRGERYKLVNGNELYDIRRDPGERKNVIADHPEIAARMRQEYARWYRGVTAENSSFTPSYTILGSEHQSAFSLDLMDRHPRGWRLKVLQSGHISCTLEEIQDDLLEAGGGFTLTAGGRSSRKTFVVGAGEVEFDAIHMSAGESYLDIAVDGLKEARKFIRIFDDLGFRRIRLEFEADDAGGS